MADSTALKSAQQKENLNYKFLEIYKRFNHNKKLKFKINPLRSPYDRKNSIL